MLKNKTKEQIKKQFKFIPTLFNHSVENDKIESCEEIIDYNKNLTAIIDIPNYTELPEFNNSKTVLICLFQIVTSGLSPFLLYLLEKNHNDLQFTKLQSISKTSEQETIDYMSNIISDGEISYAGFTETNENNILFLKYVSLTDTKSLPVNYYWATTHEIINLKSVINIPIALDVINFFINNQELLVLKNEDEVIYETPVIGYYITSREQNDIYREKRIDKYEKCYYFHINIPENSQKNIIRSALFLKKTGLINNNLSDYNSIVYNKKNCVSYYLIKDYAQHTILI
jgi:hypothetical protein